MTIYIRPKASEKWQFTLDLPHLELSTVNVANLIGLFNFMISWVLWWKNVGMNGQWLVCHHTKVISNVIRLKSVQQFLKMTDWLECLVRRVECGRKALHGKIVWNKTRVSQQSQSGSLPFSTPSICDEQGTPCSFVPDLCQHWQRHFQKDINI